MAPPQKTRSEAEKIGAVAALQPEHVVAVAVTGGCDCLELELARGDALAVGVAVGDLARLEAVVRWVEPERLRPRQADPLGVGDADRLGRLGGRPDLSPGRARHRRAAAGVIGVVVRHDDARDARGVESVPAHRRNDLIRPGPEPSVDHDQLVPVDDVGVAVEPMRQVEPVVTAADEIHVVAELHPAGRPLTQRAATRTMAAGTVATAKRMPAPACLLVMRRLAAFD